MTAPTDAAGEIRELFAYNRWANRRFLDAAAALGDEPLRRDLGSSFPSVAATLEHILSAEWIWLERWNGRSPTARPGHWNVGDLGGLRRAWDAVEAAQTAFVEGLDGDGLARGVDYRSLRGDPFRAPLWQLLRHVVNHSSYHRGQLATLLRQLGATPPNTDLVAYYRERGR